jgi:hypothetical protein
MHINTYTQIRHLEIYSDYVFVEDDVRVHFVLFNSSPFIGLYQAGG